VRLFVWGLAFVGALFAYQASAQTAHEKPGGMLPSVSQSTPEQAAQITEAIAASPELSKLLAELVSQRKLDQIKIVPHGYIFNQFECLTTERTISINGELLIYERSWHKHVDGGIVDIIPNNLVFCIGYATYHIKTPVLFQIGTKKSEQAASAYIQGWNYMIDAAVRSNRGEPLRKAQIEWFLMSLRYRDVFNKARAQQESLEILGTGKIEENQRNISSIAKAIEAIPVLQ
jgi:hypothetical protein